MRLPFHLSLPEGRGTLYLAKRQTQWPTFVRGRARGLIEWAIPIPEWTPYLLLGLLLVTPLVFGWSVGLQLRANATRVQAAKAPDPSVHDSLRSSFDAARGYAALGDWDRAIASTNSAVTILQNAESSRVRMPEESFDSLIAGLDGIFVTGAKPALQESLMRARIVLAEYHSTLEPVPLIPDDRTALAASRKLALGSHTHTGAFFLSVVDGYGLPKGADFFVPPSQVLANDIWVEGLTLVGGAQTLDGIHWRDLMFIRSHIRYQGGELELRNVRFVNCTFEIAKSGRGENVARYITLDSRVLALD